MSDGGSIWTRKFWAELEKPRVMVWVFSSLWAFILLLTVTVAPIRMREMGLSREEQFIGWGVIVVLLMSVVAFLILSFAVSALSNSKSAVFMSLVISVFFCGGILSLPHFNCSPAQLNLAILLILTAVILGCNIVLGVSLWQERRRALQVDPLR